MGVDIQTYRARIGTYKHSRCGKTIEHYRIPSGSHVAALVTNLKVSNDIKTVGCVFFIGILLMIAGVEPNPGPMEMGSDSYYSDEEPEVVKGAKKSVDVSDTSFVEKPQDIPRIIISGLMENTNKEMLAMYFEHEESNARGKVKNIAIDKKGKFATIDFEEKAGVDAFMLRNPNSILGMNVTVEVFALPVQSNDIGKLVPSTKRYEPSIDVGDLATSTRISDTSFVEESQGIPCIRISGLMENTNKEMLAMYFEHEERNGGGKVKNIAMDKKGKFATIDFEEKAGVDAFMLKNPKCILGMNVTVEVFALHVQSNDIGKLVPSTRRYEPSVDDGELTTSTRRDIDESETELTGREMQEAEAAQTTGDIDESETELTGRGRSCTNNRLCYYIYAS